MNEINEIIPLVAPDGQGAFNGTETPESLPVLVLRNAVLFPGVLSSINLNRPKALTLAAKAWAGDRRVAVTMQKDAKTEDPQFSDLYPIGVMANIVRTLEMPDTTTTIILHGLRRIALNKMLAAEPYFVAAIAPLADEMPADTKEYAALVDSIRDVALRIVQMLPQRASEVAAAIKNIDSREFLINYLAANIELAGSDKQQLLETSDIGKRAALLLEMLLSEERTLLIKRDIEKKAVKDIGKHQREYILHQQMKAIQDELGGSGVNKEAGDLRQKAKGKKWSGKVADTFERELKKLELMHPYSPEFPPQANYLQTLVELPWGKYGRDNINIDNAQKILDEDHFGLEEVKERILEHLSVMKLKRDFKSPTILCLYGPPGVGKTSLGKSVARAMGREFARIALGGMHDESEIRGHRKTYIGAMPGRIIQTLRKCKTGNPVIVLDEIDKVGSDYHGDPSSALLEVLDPAQNAAFYDNYLELEYDLSHIMFITTANNIATIQPALRDRMEIIYMSGYTQEEKVQIARSYLVPRLLGAHGLKDAQLQVSEPILQNIIANYTRESGVRGLEKQLAKLMRKTAKTLALRQPCPPDITPERLREMLGAPKFSRQAALEAPLEGVVTGLAWTQNGGEILFIEASINEGKGTLTTTGNLGEVMKESAALAFEYIKSQAQYLRIDPKLFSTRNLHIHVPEGAIPKDGPSAGVAMATSIASVFSARRARQDIAMTGEITLRGEVMPIGGVKEKILAAKRAGIASVMLPCENRRNVEEIKPEYLTGLNIIYVKTLHDVLDNALMEGGVTAASCPDTPSEPPANA